MPQCSSAFPDLGRRVRAEGRRGDARQVRDGGGDRAQLVLVGRVQRLEQHGQLGRRLGRVVVVEDSGGVLHDLLDGPVRDSIAVGETAAPVDVTALLESVHDLEQQAALSDAGRAEDRRDAGVPLLDDRVAERRQLLELLEAPDERQVDPWAAPRVVALARDLPDLDGLRLALGLHRLRLVELESVLGGPVGLLADQDPVRRRSRLDAGGGVEHVAGRRPLALARSSAEHDQRLARVDPDPDVEVEPFVLGVQVRDRLPDGEAGTNRALRVVLVRLRRPEQRQDRVAAELLERAAVPFELCPHTGVVGRNERPHVLGVELLGARGRADEVDEDRRDDLSLLARRNRRRHLGERSPARRAETCLYRVLGAALGAEGHGRSVRLRRLPS